MRTEIIGEEDDAQRIETLTENFFDKIILYVAMALFTITILLATIQVLVRNIPGLPIQHFFWTAPLARIIFIVMTYFGAAVAARNSEHISIQMLHDRIENRFPKTTRSLAIVSTIIVICVLIVAVIGTFNLSVDRWGQVIGGIDIGHYGYVYSGIAIGIGATLVYYVVRLYSDLGIDLYVREKLGEKPNTRDH